MEGVRAKMTHRTGHQLLQRPLAWTLLSALGLRDECSLPGRPGAGEGQNPLAYSLTVDQYGLS